MIGKEAEPLLKRVNLNRKSTNKICILTHMQRSVLVSFAENFL